MVQHAGAHGTDTTRSVNSDGPSVGGACPSILRGATSYCDSCTHRLLSSEANW